MIVNGKEIKISKGTSLQEFLISSQYNLSRIAVELNGKISPRKTFGEVILKDADSMEIVSFVGGG